MVEEVAEAQEGRGEPDDARLVERAGDLRGKRQQAREVRELCVLALAPRLRRVLRLVLHHSYITMKYVRICCTGVLVCKVLYTLYSVVHKHLSQ